MFLRIYFFARDAEFSSYGRPKFDEKHVFNLEEIYHAFGGL